MAPQISCEDWSLEGILALGSHIKPIQRIGVLSGESRVFDAIAQAESTGEPLVIESFHTVPTWNRKLLSPEGFIKYGEPNITARNVHTWSDTQLQARDFFERARTAPLHITSSEKERLYAKDVPCPIQWLDFLCAGNCPPHLLPQGQNDYMIPNKVQTLMCYFGIGDTATPAHKDLCASSGQNLMFYTEKGGSAFWFMTRSSDARNASDFFQKMGHELDHENYYLTLDIIARATFDIFVTEQKMGDFIMVPPRSCHQVVNKGGLSMKISWSRMTLSGLSAALYHELPMYQRVCRPEVYQIKATIFYSLHTIKGVLEKLSRGSQPDYRFGIETSGRSPVDLIQEYCQVLQTLLLLFDDILAEECPPDDTAVDVSSTEEHLTCDFCGADIFHSFFECRSCAASSGDSGYSLCTACFLDGRGCTCRDMSPQQRRPFQVLLDARERALKYMKSMSESYHQPESAKRNTQSTILLQNPQDSAYGLFRAACLIWQNRQSSSQLRACSATSPSHRVPVPDALLCRVCHNSRCYEHILQRYYVHSSVAVVVHNQSPTHKPWHTFHQESRKNRSAEGERLMTAQAQGVKPDTRVSRAWIAATFRVSQPQCPNSTLGWYDEELDGFRSYTSGFLDEDSQDELTDMTPESVSTPIPIPAKDTKSRRKRKSDSVLVMSHKRPRPSLEIPKPTSDEDKTPAAGAKDNSVAKRGIRRKKSQLILPASHQKDEIPSESVASPPRIHRKSDSSHRLESLNGDKPGFQSVPESVQSEGTKSPSLKAKAKEENYHSVQPQASPSPNQDQVSCTLADDTISHIKLLSGKIRALQTDLVQVQSVLDQQSGRATTSLPTSVQGIAYFVRRTLDTEEITSLIKLLQPPALAPDSQEDVAKSPIELTSSAASTAHSPEPYQTPVTQSLSGYQDNKDIGNQSEAGRHNNLDGQSPVWKNEPSTQPHQSEARQVDQDHGSPPMKPSNSFQHSIRGGSIPSPRGRLPWQKKHHRGRGRGAFGSEAPSKWKHSRAEMDAQYRTSEGTGLPNPRPAPYPAYQAGWSVPSSSRSWNRTSDGWNEHGRGRGSHSYPTGPRGWGHSNWRRSP